MKRIFLTFALVLTLALGTTACTAKPADTNGATGTGNGSVTQDNSRARTGMNNYDTMRRDARYYANDNGKVIDRGRSDNMGNDIRNAADDMMDGIDNAVNDMTH